MPGTIKCTAPAALLRPHGSLACAPSMRLHASMHARRPPLQACFRLHGRTRDGLAGSGMSEKPPLLPLAPQPSPRPAKRRRRACAAAPGPSPWCGAHAHHAPSTRVAAPCESEAVGRAPGMRLPPAPAWRHRAAAPAATRAAGMWGFRPLASPLLRLLPDRRRRSQTLPSTRLHSAAARSPARLVIAARSSACKCMSAGYYAPACPPVSHPCHLLRRPQLELQICQRPARHFSRLRGA
eukprot:361275-Chlamydomonas_euryale.AAC.4